MGLLSLSNLEMCINSLILKRLKSEFKGKIVSKFALGLLNAYNPMYFDKNISESKELFVMCNER